MNALFVPIRTHRLESLLSPPPIIQTRAARLVLLRGFRKRERILRGRGVVEMGGGEKQRD